MPLLKFIVNKSAKFTLLAWLLFIAELLTGVSLILIRVIQSFECSMRKFTFNVASQPSFWVVSFALFWGIIMLIGGSSVVKRLVRIDAMIPVMIFWLIWAHWSLVSIDIEHNWLDMLQVEFQSFLKGFFIGDIKKLVNHIDEIKLRILLAQGWQN